MLKHIITIKKYINIHIYIYFYVTFVTLADDEFSPILNNVSLFYV